MIVTIDARQITDWETFHSVFQAAFGFPDFYGRNMDAWIDCMTSLDAPEDGMTSIHIPPGHTLTLHLEHVDDFARRCPEQYEAMIECAAFVNWRRIKQGQPAVLALSFHKQVPGSPDQPHANLFTGDDYQLVAEAAYREEERRELFRKLYGVEAPGDDQLYRLSNLAARITEYMRDPAKD